MFGHGVIAPVVKRAQRGRKRHSSLAICVFVLCAAFAALASPGVAAADTPSFLVDVSNSSVGGWGWPSSAEVTITVDNPGGSSQDLTTHATCDGDQFRTDSLEVSFAPDAVVTVTDGVTTKATTVTSLALSGADRASSAVSGTAEAGSAVAVWVNTDEGVRREVQAESPSGVWNADFAHDAGAEPWQQAFPFELGIDGGASQEDVDGDQTRIEWRIANPVFAVHPDSDSVEGWDWPAGAHVTIAVDDPSTPLETPDLETSATVEPDGDGFDTGTLDINIVPGWKVTVSDGMTTKETTVTGIAWSGADKDSGIVTGTALAATDVRVSVYADTEVSREVTASGSGVWSANFKNVAGSGDEEWQQPYTLTPGTEGNAYQEDTDGDQTKVDWRVPNPVVRANCDENAIEGEDWPAGASISIIVDYPHTGTPTYVLTDANPDGNFRVEEVAVSAGCTVTATDGHDVKTLVVRALAVTEIDPHSGIIRGTADPNSDLDVAVYGNGEDPDASRRATADSSGVWSANFSVPVGDMGGQTAELVTGSLGKVAQTEADWDETWADWEISGPIPAAVDDAYTVDNGQQLDRTASGVLGNDSHTGATVQVLATSAHGGTLVLTPSTGGFTYTPAASWVGTDTFTYRLVRGLVVSNTATVTIAVRDAKPPTLTKDAVATYSGSAVIHLTGIDPAPSGGLDFLQWRLMKDGVVGAVQQNTVHSSTSANDVVTVTQPGSYHLYVDVQDQAGNEMDQADLAFTVTALPSAKLTVSTPKKVKRSKNFFVTGKLTPTHLGATTITLRFERYYKRKWRLGKKATVRVAAGATSYKYKAKLSPKGSWRVVAAHGADSAHTGKATATRKFTVK